MNIVNKYRVYCIEEAIFVNVLGEVEPVICPNDHSDRTINASQTIIIDSIDQSEVKIVEPTSGQYRLFTVKYDIPAGNVGDVTTIDKSYPMDISIWKTEIYSFSDNVGDEVTASVAPNTTVGVLTAVANIGSTTLTVSSTAVNNIFVSKGTYLRLYNNPTFEEVGRITSFDVNTNTITFENPLTNSFPIGSLIQMELTMIDKLLLYKSEASYFIGDKGFKSKQLPTGKIIRIKYTNNTALAKKLVIYIECYFS
jgi:hypothetical protein